MFDIGWMELMVIGVVALIVVGPRDLPEMFRQLGRFTGKLRQMSREFSRAMEQAANDSGMKEAVRDINTLADPGSAALNSVKGAVDKFEKWDPMKNAAKPTQPIEQRAPLVPPPMPPVVPAPAVSGPAVPEPVVAETPVSAPGPNTQALYAKQAARKAIMEETAAKLKALDEAPDAAAETLSRLGKELTDEAEG